MPYVFTDAIAMQVPVIATDISDLGVFGRQGYVRLVVYGDFEALQATVKDLFERPEEKAAMVDAARKLYLRQFSYRAARANFDLIYDAAIRNVTVLPAAQDFAKFYSRFHESVAAASQEPAS